MTQSFGRSSWSIQSTKRFLKATDFTIWPFPSNLTRAQKNFFQRPGCLSLMRDPATGRGEADEQMQIEERIEIDRPPEAVWPVLVDVERWPEWTLSVTAIERLDQSAFGMDSRVRIRQPKLKTMIWRVSKF